MATPVGIKSRGQIAQRRRAPRTPLHFPIERELRFRIVNKRDETVGSGKTIDIGSKRILFRTDQTLASGNRVQMAISWPAQLDRKCSLKLIASGRVVRAEPGVVAVSIERYEFRILGRNGLAI
jgi:hypothetical protein